MIDFTPREQQIVAIYRAGGWMGRSIRLSVQYAIGAGLFTMVCIHSRNPYWSLAVLGVFVASMVVRLIAARRLAGIMPSVIAKYERRIEELEQSTGQAAP